MPNLSLIEMLLLAALLLALAVISNYRNKYITHKETSKNRFFALEQTNKQVRMLVKKDRRLKRKLNRILAKQRYWSDYGPETDDDFS